MRNNIILNSGVKGLLHPPIKLGRKGPKPKLKNSEVS